MASAARERLAASRSIDSRLTTTLDGPPSEGGKHDGDNARAARRLSERASRASPGWKRWGPYLSERQWGTVREDYSEDGDAWDYFPHDQARSRAYRWGEDGLAGISDDQQRLCFALALWNGRDPILKERLFGLTEQRGQPRRGRQGVLLLPRQHADPLLHEATSTSTRRRPSPTPTWSRRTAGAAARRWSTSCSTPASSTTTATSTSSSSTPRPAPDDILMRDHRHQPRAGAGRAAPAADALVPQRLGVLAAAAGREAGAQAGRRAGGRQRGRGDRTRRSGTYYLYCDGAARAALHRERDQQRAALPRAPERQPVRQGRHQRLRGRRAGGGGQPRPARHQGGRALPADGRPRPGGDGAAAPERSGPRRAALARRTAPAPHSGRASTRRSPPGCARRTSSTAR